MEARRKEVKAAKGDNLHSTDSEELGRSKRKKTPNQRYMQPESPTYADVEYNRSPQSREEGNSSDSSLGDGNEHSDQSGGSSSDSDDSGTVEVRRTIRPQVPKSLSLFPGKIAPITMH